MGRETAAAVGLGVALAFAAAWMLTSDPTPSPSAPVAGPARTDPRAPRAARGAAAEAPSAPEAAPGAPPPVDLASCDRELDLFGEVVDVAGTPVAGAELRTVQFPWTRFDARWADRRADALDGPSATSATDGTFRLRLARHAATTLRVSAGGFATTEFPDRRAGERARLVLPRAVSMRVHAMDANSADLGGVIVRFAAESHEAQCTTGADGRAEMTGLPAETAATLGFRRGSDVGGLRRGVVTASADSSLVELQVPDAVVVTGRVTDAATGDPVRGATVAALVARAVGASTDEDGRYRLTATLDPADGRYLEARADGFAADIARVAADGTRDFRLTPAATATGRVIDTAGAPIAGARVEVSGTRSDGERLARSVGHAATSADGRFFIEGLLPGLDHTLLVIAEGRGRSVTAWTSVRPDAGDVVLGEARTLVGRVADTAGRAVPDVTIELTGIVTMRSASKPRMPRWTARTDDLGRFAFAGLSAGDHEAALRRPGVPEVRRRVTIAADADPPELVLTVSAGREVTVRVRDDAGAPVQWALVTLRTTDDLGVATTDTAGTARCLVIDEGAQVAVEPPLHKAARYETPSPIPVPASGTVDVVLVRAGCATGRVLGADGSPAAGWWVEVRRDRSVISRALSQSDGAFDVAVPRTGAVSLVTAGRNDFDRSADRLAARNEGVTDGATNLELRLAPVVNRAQLTIRVLSPSGDPVASAQLAVNSRRVRTGSDGCVALADLPDREIVALLFLPDRPFGAPRSDWRAPSAVRVRPEGQEVVLRYETARFVTVVIPAVALPEPRGPVTLIRVAAFAGDRSAATAARATEPGQTEWTVEVPLPADEPGPFRLELSSSSARSRLRGSLDGVRADAGTVRLVAEAD